MIYERNDNGISIEWYKNFRIKALSETNNNDCLLIIRFNREHRTNASDPIYCILSGNRIIRPDPSHRE